MRLVGREDVSSTSELLTFECECGQSPRTLQINEAAPNWHALAKSSHQLRGERMMVAWCTVRWRSPSTLRSASAPFIASTKYRRDIQTALARKRWNASQCAVFSMRIPSGQSGPSMED